MAGMRIVCNDIASGLNERATSILTVAGLSERIELYCRGAIYLANQTATGRLTIHKGESVVAIATYQKKPPRWHVQLLD